MTLLCYRLRSLKCISLYLSTYICDTLFIMQQWREPINNPHSHQVLLSTSSSSSTSIPFSRVMEPEYPCLHLRKSGIESVTTIHWADRCVVLQLIEFLVRVGTAVNELLYYCRSRCDHLTLITSMFPHIHITCVTSELVTADVVGVHMQHGTTHDVLSSSAKTAIFVDMRYVCCM